MQSQSWQTDFLNLQLTLTVKPMFKYISSLQRLRQMVSLMDNTVGRLAIPRGTRREPVSIPRADFEAEWVYPDNSDPERVVLYLPGGAYVIRMQPGAQTIAHTHGGNEDYLIIEGEVIESDGTVLKPGTFVHYEPGTHHNSRTETGCLLIGVDWGKRGERGEG